jgi:hypothetical protein
MDSRGSKWWVGREALELSQRQVYYRFLREGQFATDPFPGSTTISNRDAYDGAFDGYINELPQYDFKQGVDENNFELLIPGNFNIGHKLHLNVPIEHVRSAAGYLKDGGFFHKYLWGGELQDGKIFTIYTGSKKKTDLVAKQLSEEMQPWLRRPIDRQEVEYAPSITGRFCAINVHVKEDPGTEATWHQYGVGLRGIPILRQDATKFIPGFGRQIKPGDPDYQTELLAAFDRSYNKIADKFGPYFYGE